MTLHLTRIAVERYKAFEQSCELEIRPLTILVGANGAGKSALAEAIPLLAGGLLGGGSEELTAGLPLESFGRTHGPSFQSLIAGGAGQDSLRLEAGFRAGHVELGLAVAVRSVASPEKGSRQVVDEWTLTLTGGRQVVIERPEPASREHRITVCSRGAAVEMRAAVGWDGLIPRSEALSLEAPEHGWLKEALAALAEWSRGVTYLGAPRELQSSPFTVLPSPAGGVGARGREAPRLLAIYAKIQDRVTAWYRDTFRVDLRVRYEGETASLEVRREPGGEPVPFAQAGQGLSQVLSVAVQCAARTRAGAGVDVIEYPEAGLHPGAHAAVADLIVERLRGPSRPMVVETHSEVLLLRLRRRIVEQRLRPEDVAIYFVGRDDDTGSAGVHRTEITASGDVSNWPGGVFEEDYEEVVAIRREARRRGKDRDAARDPTRGPGASR